MIMKWKLKKNLSWALAALGIAASVGWAATGTDVDHNSTLSPMTEVSPQVEQAIESANSLSTAFRSVANRLLPTVVSIENRPKIALVQDRSIQPSQHSPEDFPGGNPFQGTPFEDFFKGREFRMQPPGMGPGGNGSGRGGPGDMRPQPSPGGIGSGVIIDSSGVILTNNHVVAGGGEVTVRTYDGKEFIASQVWTDPKTDLAVVRIEGATGLVAAPLGDSDQVEIGDWVIALGQPFGLESTVTAGIISAKNRGIGINARENYLQTDAAINPGNSGGPLVNLRGEVVGINTAISSRSGGNDGIGFAVPSNLARWVSDQLVSSGAVRRAYLGVGIQPITQDLATQLSVEPRGGVVVTDVFPGTPAAKVGLETGDVIVKFAGTRIGTPQQLQLAVERSAIGQELAIEVVRDGKSISLKYIGELQPGDFGTGDSETPQGSQPGNSSESYVEDFGMEVATLDDAVADQLGMDDVRGVVITQVQAGSKADTAGLASGMVITQVNRKTVSSVGEFLSAIRQDKDQNGTLLLVRTEQGSRFIVLK